jgi:hypothetical protein
MKEGGWEYNILSRKVHSNTSETEWYQNVSTDVLGVEISPCICLPHSHETWRQKFIYHQLRLHCPLMEASSVLRGPTEYDHILDLLMHINFWTVFYFQIQLTNLDIDYLLNIFCLNTFAAAFHVYRQFLLSTTWGCTILWWQKVHLINNL